MTRMLEAVIDESGEVHLMQPLFIKGIHRALVTIFDDPPRLPSETNAPDIEQGEADSEEAKALFGIWKDNHALRENRTEPQPHIRNKQGWSEEGNGSRKKQHNIRDTETDARTPHGNHRRRNGRRYAGCAAFYAGR